MHHLLQSRRERGVEADARRLLVGAALVGTQHPQHARVDGPGLGMRRRAARAEHAAGEGRPRRAFRLDRRRAGGAALPLRAEARRVEHRQLEAAGDEVQAVAALQPPERDGEQREDRVRLGVLDGETVGQLQQVQRRGQPIEVGVDAREELSRLGLRHHVERAAVREHHLGEGQRLEMAGEPAARPQHALRHRVALAVAGAASAA